MIDLHCHILPGLDDGAMDVQDSLAMALQAQQDGITVICATPHIRHDHDVRIHEISGRVRALQAQIDEGGIDVTVVPGGEIAETEADRLSDEQLALAALGGAGGWVLLEPAPGPMSASLERTAGGLAERGVLTVLAHPERHADADFMDRLARLAGMGCVIQWTSEFIAEIAPQELLRALADAGLLHLLSSDAHSSRAGRPVRLTAGFERLELMCSPEQLEWSRDLAPRAILDGVPVTPPR